MERLPLHSRELRIALAVLLLILVAFVSAVAQSNSCIVTYGFFCGDSVRPGTISCITEGSCQAVCYINNNKCAPPAAADETCPTCARGNHTAGAPISLASGDTSIEQTDVRLPGLGGGLLLVRTWNSKWPASQSAFQVGLFGPNWRSNFEERVFVGSDGYVKYARGDGSFWSFGAGGAGYLPAAPANIAATLTTGTTNWTLILPNGETRLFDNTTGSLISISDRNGNTTQLTYDSSLRLITATDAASRHLYFSYGTGANNLVTSVTSDVGISLTYAYDSQGRLTQITKPDNTTLSFEYDSQSRITAVKDSSGKILESHTYDSVGRGLTSSRANGVEAVTVNYIQ